MITSYKKAKEDILQFYDEFLQVVDIAGLPADDTSLTSLRLQAKKIKEDRFCLMIAGEAKSGKSTFINAYLGTEILPMDVRQCTSSVVEIRYGSEFHLRAIYADGREKTFVGENDIKAFLIPAPSIFWLEKNEQYASFQKQSSLDTYARFCTAQIIRKGEKQNALDH